jgi:hypothetical protein
LFCLFNEYTIRYSPHWRIPVISPGGGFNYHFDNKREYQLLTRMLHSSKTIVHFISRVILPHFNWTSVRIIAERNVVEAQVSWRELIELNSFEIILE